MTENIQDLTVVIVDDDEVAVRAITRALRKHGITNPTMTAYDGMEALELLRGQADRVVPWPYVLLLDLNMPRMDGIEFLNEIREDDRLVDTVVFMLTTSDDERDMVAAYQKNVAGYILKSSAGQDFVNLVSMIDSFTLTVRFHEKTERPAA